MYQWVLLMKDGRRSERTLEHHVSPLLGLPAASSEVEEHFQRAQTHFLRVDSAVFGAIQPPSEPLPFLDANWVKFTDLQISHCCRCAKFPFHQEVKRINKNKPAVSETVMNPAESKNASRETRSLFVVSNVVRSMKPFLKTHSENREWHEKQSDSFKTANSVRRRAEFPLGGVRATVTPSQRSYTLVTHFEQQTANREGKSGASG